MAPLPDGVIHYLRSYWKNIWLQPASWLFYGASPDQPMRTQALYFAFKKARDTRDNFALGWVLYDHEHAVPIGWSPRLSRRYGHD